MHIKLFNSIGLRIRRITISGILVGLLTISILVIVSTYANVTAATPAKQGSVPDALKTKLQRLEGYGKLPLAFEANQGQTDAKVRFLSRGIGYTLFLTPSEVVFTLGKAETQAKAKSMTTKSQPAELRVLRMQFVGANPEPKMVGLDELPGKSHYFIGNDPNKWRANVPRYAKVRYQDIYPGVDLVYYGTNQQQLEYDFVVAAGADPRVITLGLHGIDGFNIDPKGHLILHAAGGKVEMHAPVIFQEVNGTRREISGGYVVKDKYQVGFEMAAYDLDEPLVIDPVLEYSTYLGGVGTDRGHAIAVDANGNAYVTGSTGSSNFPTTPGAYQPDEAGAFVTKLNATGDQLVYSTYLGGSGGDTGYGIAVDADGNAYVTGKTSSADFPTAPFLPLQQDLAPAGTDAFITKLNAAGDQLVYSTYLGGTGNDQGSAIAVDANGRAWVTGFAGGDDFPTSVNAFQSTRRGAFDAFVVRLDSKGTVLDISTYLGGESRDFGEDIAVDATGAAYVTGYTESGDNPVTPQNESFPTTAGAFQSTRSSTPCPACNVVGRFDTDAFVTKVDASGALVYSTFLGGSGGVSNGGNFLPNDVGSGIAVDAEGNAYVTGNTSATDEFPTTPGVFQETKSGLLILTSAFVTKLNPMGSELVYSTYLGGSNSSGSDIAVDADGNAYVTGGTYSSDFPVTPDALQPATGGDSDAFVTKLNPAGTGLVYSSYLGGGSSDGPKDPTDSGSGIAVDADGNIYVTGFTLSTDFPTLNAFQPDCGPSFIDTCTGDAFVAKIIGGSGMNNSPSTPDPVFPSNGQTGLGTTVTFSWNESTDPDGDSVTYQFVVCDNTDFDGCSPEVLAALVKKGVVYAGLGGTGVMLLFMGVGLGRGRRRRTRALLSLGVILLASGMLLSCGGGGGGGAPIPLTGEMSHTVSGLSPGTTYYWQIIADDGNGGVAKSQVRSFTTSNAGS